MHLYISILLKFLQLYENITQIFLHHMYYFSIAFHYVNLKCLSLFLCKTDWAYKKILTIIYVDRHTVSITQTILRKEMNLKLKERKREWEDKQIKKQIKMKEKRNKPAVYVCFRC